MNTPKGLNLAHQLDVIAADTRDEARAALIAAAANEIRALVVEIRFLANK